MNYNCPSCEREFADEYGLGRHNAAKHGAEPPSPSLRQRRAPQGPSKPSTGAYGCGSCERKFASQRGMERHCAAKDHEEGGYDASGEVEDVVGGGRGRRRKPRGVAAAAEAVREASRVAPLGTGRYGCVECGKRFVTENGLARHQDDKDHAGSEVLEALVLDGIIGCAVCGKVFGSARGLERHCDALNHDGNDGSAATIEAARAVCVCGKVLRSQHALDRHMAAKGCADSAPSNGDRGAAPVVPSDPVYCHACNRECKSERSLERHLDVTGHRDEPEGGASYVCGTCERVLDSMHALGRHQEAFDHQGSSSHPGRDFGIQCPNCFRKFGTEAGLAPHIEEKHLPYEDESGDDGEGEGEE